MNTSMKEYLGVEVKVNLDGEMVNGYVVGCDRTIGITIKNDVGKDLVCLNKKDILDRGKYRYKGRKYYYLNRLYHEWFNRNIEQIKKGIFFPSTIICSKGGSFKLSYETECFGLGTQMTCAFN